MRTIGLLVQQRLKQKVTIIGLFTAVHPVIVTGGFMSRLLQIPWSGFGKVTNPISLYVLLKLKERHWNLYFVR